MRLMSFESDMYSVRMESPLLIFRNLPGGTRSIAQCRTPAVSSTYASCASAKRNPFSYVQLLSYSSQPPPWPCVSSREQHTSTASRADRPRSRASRSRSIPSRRGSVPSSLARALPTASLPPTTPNSLAPISQPHNQRGRERITAAVFLTSGITMYVHCTLEPSGCVAAGMNSTMCSSSDGLSEFFANNVHAGAPASPPFPTKTKVSQLRGGGLIAPTRSVGRRICGAVVDLRTAWECWQVHFAGCDKV
mmetsp:Transcript_7580/g.12893  ORF Transcript_7580/g.12893 Transcript_7580/m.12893 type:complete len:249 (+) Transcript_7580:80-826(+)